MRYSTLHAVDNPDITSCNMTFLFICSNEGLNGDASVTHCDPIVTSTPKEIKETQRLGGRLEIYSQTVCTHSYEIENIRMDLISVIKFT